MSNSGGKWITRKRRMAIYHRDGFCCAYCNEPAEQGTHLTLDHVKPLEHGGSHKSGNLVTCCLSCNSRKQDLTIRQWYRLLRSEGYNTDAIGRRVRRLQSRPLDVREGARLENLRRSRLKPRLRREMPIPEYYWWAKNRTDPVAAVELAA
jgi:hypothetical protein